MPDSDCDDRNIGSYVAGGLENRDISIGTGWYSVDLDICGWTTGGGVMNFKKYTDLTETQLKKLARLCVQEQGSVAGVKAEASLMANLLETSESRKKKYGTNGAGLYNWVRNGGWFYRAAYFMDNTNVGNKYVEAVRDVLVNGNRTLPLYVDEHDCFNDIRSISTGSIRDKSAYIPHKTVVKNKMGSTWTFYCFPSSGSDPFGYTKEAYEYVINQEQKAVSKAETMEVTAHVPEIQRGDSGEAVKVWQTIVGVTNDGDFGPVTQAATVKMQLENGLTADGIVGKCTWEKGLFLNG